MRCKCCNNIMQPWEIKYMPEKRVFEDLCNKCKAYVFADLCELEEADITTFVKDYEGIEIDV